MYVSVNERNEIKEVGISTDTSLTSIYIDENAPMYPFKNWSNAKICCYRVNVTEDGIVTMLTAYIDSRYIDHFDQVGKDTETNAEDISSNRDGIMETFETSMLNTDDIAVLREGLEEVYELLLGESEE